MNLFLCGFMGVGKTEYGKRLAKQMNLNFIDTDTLIEEQENSTLPEIFEEKGESYFRQKEHELLKDLDIADTVISTGGGMPAYANNMDLINSKGLSILLSIDRDKLLKRIQKDVNLRPLIKGMNPKELQRFVSDEMRNRALYYNQCEIVINPQYIAPKVLKEVITERYL